jgi:hypothetical protein
MHHQVPFDAASFFQASLHFESSLDQASFYPKSPNQFPDGEQGYRDSDGFQQARKGGTRSTTLTT